MFVEYDCKTLSKNTKPIPGFSCPLPEKVSRRSYFRNYMRQCRKRSTQLRAEKGKCSSSRPSKRKFEDSSRSDDRFTHSKTGLNGRLWCLQCDLCDVWGVWGVCDCDVCDVVMTAMSVISLYGSTFFSLFSFRGEGGRFFWVGAVYCECWLTMETPLKLHSADENFSVPLRCSNRKIVQILCHTARLQLLRSH